MVSKETLIPLLRVRLKKLQIGEGIDLRTYKRNRSVLILKVEEDIFKFVERGFFEEEFYVKEKDLEKNIKRILKREFPRSHKIRLYTVAGDEMLPFKKI